MTDREIDALLAQAEADFNANEQVMLIAPLAVIGLIEQLRACERKVEAIGSYDLMHGPENP